MKNRIAAAFQNTVDFELQWDLNILEALIRHYGIRRSEIQIKCPIRSLRPQSAYSPILRLSVVIYHHH